jgi:aspartate/methionine/tyrosine aminotransferase
MTLKVSRRGQVPPFIVMDVMRAAAEKAASGGDVLHLEVGQPSTGAPSRVIEAAKQALDADLLGYTLALGIEPLRQRIARHYRTAYGAEVRADNVVVTTGSSGAFLLAFLAAFEAGDRVGLAAPGYPAYRNILSALGVEPVLLPVGPASRFQPAVEVVREFGGRLDGLIVASPSNPTGSMLSAAELSRLADWCGEEGVRLVSDEIYHGITYGQAAATAAGRTEALVINSFSKYYSMTGWRLGWMVVPDDLLRAVECLAQNLFISPPALSQQAAVAAFDCAEELDANVARYAKNREVLLGDLPAAGFDRLAPADGAFYLYADVSRWTNDSLSFCRRMLAETGVACTPGVDFDPLEGQRFIRFCFAGATADMAEAARRLAAWKK